MSGWFSVKHGITRHPLFKGRPERLAIWLWLIDNAAYQATEHDINGQTVTVPRGAVAVSERRIAEDVGVGYQVVRTFISRLKSEHMINATVTHGKNIISLCNYEKYQTATGQPNAAPNAPLTQDQRIKVTRKQGLSKEADASLSSGDDISQAVQVYNSTASEAGWPSVAVLSKSRKAALSARLRECGGIDGWRDAMAKARASPHLCGQNDRGWTASFDFLTRQSSFAKLMEGNYDARQSQKTNGHQFGTTIREAARRLSAGEIRIGTEERDPFAH